MVLPLVNLNLVLVPVLSSFFWYGILISLAWDIIAGSSERLACSPLCILSWRIDIAVLANI